MYLPAHHCYLRSWHPSDVTSLVEHANNYQVWIQLRDRLPHPYTEVDARNWISFATSQEPLTNLAIEFQGIAVGSIGLTLQDDIETGTAEVGYWLGEAVWGQGIATAALSTFAEWAFNEFSLRRLYAMPLVSNQASRRVLEKVGFQLEGILRQHVCKAGIVQDQAIYGLLRNELVPYPGSCS